MNSDQEKLKSLLRRSGDPGAAPLTAEETQWLGNFRKRYPFFSIPSAAPGEEPSLRDVVTAPSREALARLQGNEEASRFDDFYPEGKGAATPTTTAAIDDFLNTYGHRSQEEDQLLERLIFNPVPDYAQQLAREEEASLPQDPGGLLSASAGGPIPAEGLSPEARLNRFILSHRHGSNPPTPDKETETSTTEETEKNPYPPSGARIQSEARAGNRLKEEKKAPGPTPPDGLLSVSLAKIYIKTRRYEQAYEILNGISLRFPEKSRYFADQLRFLRKLIINERRLRIEIQGKDSPNP